MVQLIGKEAYNHMEKFKVTKLDFDWCVYKIIEIKENNSYIHIGAKFIAKKENTNEYYLAEWTIGGSSSYTEVYVFIKIDYNLYISYLKGDISYHRFHFESLKINDVCYRVHMNINQFESGNRNDNMKRIFFEGNKIEYTKVLVIDFDNMPGWCMTIPYEYKDEYGEIGYTCETYKWDNNNDYKKAARAEYKKINNNLLSFIRDLKLKELLD